MPLLLIGGLSCSEPPDQTTLATTAGHPLPSLESLVAEGESAYGRSQFDSAQTIWRSALLETERPADSAGQARILTLLGLAAWRTGAYSEARKLGEQALAIKLRIGLTGELFRSYNALGLLAWNEGRLRDATDLFEQAIAIARSTNDASSLAKAANNIALVYTELGNFAAARAGFTAARSAGRELADTAIEGRSLNNLGMLEIQVGDPWAAIEALVESRRLYRAINDQTGEQNALGQLGTAYDALGEPHFALAALDSALTLARQQGLKQEEASNLELIAGVYRQTGNLQRALELYEMANLLNSEMGLEVERGTNLRNSAEIHAAMGRVDLGLARVQEALAVHRKTGARLRELQDLLLLADLASVSGRPESEVGMHLAAAGRVSRILGARAARADVAVTTATIADRAGQSLRVLRVIHGARGDLDRGEYHMRWRAAALRARAFHRLNQPDSAIAAGREAVAAVERVRSRFGSSMLRTSYGAEKMQPYSDLIDILIGADQLEEAFEVADGARSRALLEHMATSASDGTPTSTVGALADGEVVLRQIDALISRLNVLEETPPAERDRQHFSQMEELTNELGVVRDGYESLLLRVAELDAGGSTILGGHRLKTADVRRVLQPGELLLAYFVSSSRLIAFGVTQQGVRIVTVDISRDDLAGRVRMARDLVGKRASESSATNNVLTGLDGILLAPLRAAGLLQGIRTIILVPHSILAYLPFPALRDKVTGQYLIQNYTLMHLPSAAALAFLLTDTLSSPVTGDPPRPVILAPFTRALPGSAREARAVERTLSDPLLVSGSRATEPVLRRALAAGGVVHVASHGRMNPRNPMFSRIELATGRGGRQDDGRLEVHEVLALRVNGSLIFLSGCETGVGAAWSTQYARGEDYATLAQAFLYAGARSVLATLWPIQDDGAAELAARFYARLTTADPIAALAGAQRDMLATPEYTHPYFWAGYQLTGDPGRLRTSGGSNPYNRWR